MPGAGPRGPSAVSTTGLVTPCSVRLPLIVTAPLLVTLVLVNVAAG